MIHAYLIKKKMEDRASDNHYHGRNFKAKMDEINSLTGLNVSVTAQSINFFLSILIALRSTVSA